MSFEEVSKAWASRKLSEAGVEHTAIRNVSFDVNHSGGCYGHSEGEYCYCETTVWTDVYIFYFNGTKKCLSYNFEYGQYRLGDLIKELVECDL